MSPLIAVASPSFSQHPILRKELLDVFPYARFNDAGSRFASSELIKYLSGADGAVIGLETIDAGILDALPQLKIIAKYGVGLDSIDLFSMQQRGVVLGWTPGVNARSVSELTLCFMLGLFRNVLHTSSLLRAGQWKKNGGTQLSGKTIGIVGVGAIGQDLIKLLQGFGCTILTNDIEDRSAFLREYGAYAVDKHTLFSTADVITLHVPLTEETRGMVDAEVLAKVKASAFLINTSRGGIVDELALKDALSHGKLAGAALDVFACEPPEDTELLQLPNFFGTPHIGGNANEAILAMGRSAIHHLSSHFGK